MKFMTAKCALVKHLLSGQIINIKTCFTLIGLTNCPREISRMIENPKTGFGVTISRTHMVGESRYKQPVVWIDYRLVRTKENEEGIKRMTEYLLKNDSDIAKTGFLTDKERRAENPIVRKNKPQQTSTLFNSI